MYGVNMTWGERCAELPYSLSLSPLLPRPHLKKVKAQQLGEMGCRSGCWCCPSALQMARTNTPNSNPSPPAPLPPPHKGTSTAAGGDGLRLGVLVLATCG